MKQEKKHNKLFWKNIDWAEITFNGIYGFQGILYFAESLNTLKLKIIHIFMAIFQKHYNKQERQATKLIAHVIVTAKIEAKQNLYKKNK